MKHEYYEILASRDKDNDLSGEEKDILTKHLFTCKKCQKLKTEFSSLSHFLGGETSVNVHNKKSTLFGNYKKHILSVAALLIVAGVSFITFMGSDKSQTDYVAQGITENMSELDEATVSANNEEEVVLSAYFDYTDLSGSEEGSDEEYDIASSYFSYTSGY